MNMNFLPGRTKPLATAILFTMVFASPALAIGILDLDANGDGSISSAEAQQVLESQFDKMDANKDGTLSRDEFTDARLAELGRLDADHDGEITRAELRKNFHASMRR